MGEPRQACLRSLGVRRLHTAADRPRGSWAELGLKELIASLRSVEPRIEGFDHGWVLDGTTGTQPYLDLAETAEDVNWSDELENLHADTTRTHFIDRLTRHEIVSALRDARSDYEVITDLGCSSGYLLEDLQSAFPGALFVGIDLVPSGLKKAHELVPDALLLRADATSVPLPEQSVDAVVSANLLEHIPDDLAALRQMHRMLRPGGLAALVVPHGPQLFDYYDAHLGHVRRYAHGELARKAASTGFDVVRETAIGALLYPAFWARKKLNRRFARSLTPAERAERVRGDITGTSNSRLGLFVCDLERRAFDRGVDFRAGIRRLLVARRATSSGR